jgi:hypothetical protein
MFRLSHIPPEEATGKVAEVYGMFPEGVPVPTPLQMFSASPGLLAAQGGAMQYLSGHKELSFHLLALIRFLSACHSNYGFCKKFNGDLLRQSGMSDEDLAAIQEDPGKAPIEDNEKTLLAFVQKAVKDPDSVTDQDIDLLRKEGWSDANIFDATALGAMMVAGRILNTAFVK